MTKRLPVEHWVIVASVTSPEGKKAHYYYCGKPIGLPRLDDDVFMPDHRSATKYRSPTRLAKQLLQLRTQRPNVTWTEIGLNNASTLTATQAIHHHGRKDMTKARTITKPKAVDTAASVAQAAAAVSALKPTRAMPEELSKLPERVVHASLEVAATKQYNEGPWYIQLPQNAIDAAASADEKGYLVYDTEQDQPMLAHADFDLWMFALRRLTREVSIALALEASGLKYTQMTIDGLGVKRVYSLFHEDLPAFQLQHRLLARLAFVDAVPALMLVSDPTNPEADLDPARVAALKLVGITPHVVVNNNEKSVMLDVGSDILIG